MQIGLYILIDGYLHYHKSYLEQYNSFNVHFETNTTLRVFIYILVTSRHRGRQLVRLPRRVSFWCILFGNAAIGILVKYGFDILFILHHLLA